MRERLYEELCMMLLSSGCLTESNKNQLYVILDRYEIQERSTEIAQLQGDRNEMLLKQFIIGKTIKGCTKRTIEYYTKQLRFIFDRIGKTIDDITAEDIRYYMAIRQARDGITRVTADNELRCLRTFYQYMTRNEYLVKNPTEKIDSIKVNRTKKEALTEIEVELLRNAAQNNRERAVIEILLSTGCRVSELVQMKIDDIENNKVVVHGKGEKDRTVYLNAKAQVAIKNYLDERSDNNPFLFAGGIYMKIATERVRGKQADWYKKSKYVNSETHIEKGTIEGITRNIAKRAGVEKANPHKFRRTCATMALRHGMPIEQVSKMLGHEQISTTQLYLDLGDNELEQLHEKYVI